MKLQIVIPKGWRRIRTGTIVQGNDRRADTRDGKWVPCHEYLHTVGEAARTGIYIIRRVKLPSPPRRPYIPGGLAALACLFLCSCAVMTPPVQRGGTSGSVAFGPNGQTYTQSQYWTTSGDPLQPLAELSQIAYPYLQPLMWNGYGLNRGCW